MSSNRFLIHNGVVSPPSDTPLVSTFLESHPGAYTTTRTHNNASLLVFWERHLRRLTDSARILINSNPELFFKYGNPTDSISSPLMAFSRWESVIRSLVNDSVREVLPVALKERKSGEELAITALLSGNLGNLSEIAGVDEERVSRIFDVYVHVGMYAPSVFGIQENAAHLALVGRGRDVADAKYSDWVRFRKPLERLRPPLTTELLLSNDGDQILEGCMTNLFVVCRKNHNDSSNGAKDIDGYNTNTYPFEIQTAAIKDGVLPGIIRQVIIDICMSNEIPLREVAPSWSKREIWEEAFITSSLRILQHVETIQVPHSWKSLESKSWKDVMWENKHFKEVPGKITTIIQKEIIRKVGVESYEIA
ncbi:D-alanine aminotransferase [Actinidia chinensis var. chinensis]|uniref:D-alanine aminotransferase n=1 Tax=Actinidia chinensis var. chinensis TaxID=1590841 RepID=A0A2R6PYG6_ACTCC|nr:D-alanine aminotransferase [Actinidia chinensis var. chinensis]